MIAYILRRLGAGALLLVIVTLVTFGIFYVVPRLAGQTTEQLATMYVGRAPTPEAIQATIDRLGLDQPIALQFWEFLKGIFVGAEYQFGRNVVECSAPCFGYSFQNYQEVFPEIVRRLPVTFSLAIGAAVIWLVGGVTVGMVSAIKKGSVFDRIAMGIALAGVSLPVFFTGLLALAFLVHAWGIFPSPGYTPFLNNPVAWATGLVLPWLTLAFLHAAMYARQTRAGMLETMGEDYIRTARAKGLKERTVVFKHGLRPTLTPILTIFGLDLGLVLGGAVLTEQVYSLNGIGRYAVQAIVQSDLPVILGVTLFGAFFVVVCNLIVDLLYAWVDPRVRVAG
ncbi:ABC transporter permease [Marinitenerispora sediminis]|uniref:ABC transporter permease n=1 Tax=Marinitenerispora sediminis TaxID=1931232 RepID=A0A368T9R9_9ACTN|nr:ABC transporter permease [Marinitenerispora sediminis]RCV52434.1 ABC transporter permease [Marinitenerispora sediminis]RCV60632.1 ABC transporter permease [Marinitenerispora sediminis]RCV61105.1 ABC transporter permease [Marinitenerispora sediminis]